MGTSAGEAVMEKLDAGFLEGEFLTTVQKRGAAVIAARKLSSAASAAKAICDHLRDWVLGTDGSFVSMAVMPAETKYGIDNKLFYSYPCTCKDGEWTVVEGLVCDDFSTT